MKRVYEEVERNPTKLDDALLVYFPAGSAQAPATLLSSSFSRCGQCGGMMDLRQNSGGAFPQYALYCASCALSLSVPSKQPLQPHAHICPICQFQVLSVTNEQTQKTHTLCPYCFNFPPPGDIEDAAQGQAFTAGGFRCFQVAFSTQMQPLSNASFVL